MKKIFFLSILISTSLFLNAQTRSGSISDVQRNQNQRNQTDQNERQRGFQRENLRFGGSLGASFGNTTFVDISPMVGYQFTPRLQAGLGVIYNYFSIRDRWTGERFSMHVFGVNPYAQFVVIQIPQFHFFLRAEYAVVNYDVNFWWSNLDRKREWQHYPLIGGGVLLPVGRNGGISLQVMWDLLENNPTIFGRNPIFRMGIMFGL
ncbi:MAG: hypothetical protein FWC98_02060 [Bacteroidales bacterium]|nr:hypothetical protein [Bacteroidales bacterium]